MSHLASCSEHRVRRTVVLLLVWFAAVAQTAPKVHLTREAALEQAFGDGVEVRRATEFLSEEQVEAARELAGPGVEVRSAMVLRYEAVSDGAPAGFAYFDTHRVRTLQETLMVVVDPDGKVARVDVLTFDEPETYLPREAWYRQFDGRELDPELALKRGVNGITGATLSAEAAAGAVRRVLAIHQVLEREDAP